MLKTYQRKLKKAKNLKVDCIMNGDYTRGGRLRKIEKKLLQLVDDYTPSEELFVDEIGMNSINPEDNNRWDIQTLIEVNGRLGFICKERF